MFKFIGSWRERRDLTKKDIEVIGRLVDHSHQIAPNEEGRQRIQNMAVSRATSAKDTSRRTAPETTPRPRFQTASTITAGLAFTAMIALSAVTLSQFTPGEVIQKQRHVLPVVGTAENMLELLEAASEENPNIRFDRATIDRLLTFQSNHPDLEAQSTDGQCGRCHTDSANFATGGVGDTIPHGGLGSRDSLLSKRPALSFDSGRGSSGLEAPVPGWAFNGGDPTDQIGNGAPFGVYEKSPALTDESDGRRGHRLGSSFTLGQSIYHAGGVTDALDYIPGSTARLTAIGTPQILGGTDDFSGTNVQVPGVDEADIVKTDGKYIYQVRGNELLIVDAFPSSELGLLSTTEFDEEFIPSDIFLNEDRLVVVGRSPAPESETKESFNYNLDFRNGGSYRSGSRSVLEAPVPGWAFADDPPDSGVTEIRVIDVEDRTDPLAVRTVRLEGAYVSARVVDEQLYLVARNTVTMSIDPSEATPDAISIPTPRYWDSIAGEDSMSTNLDDLEYFPEAVAPDYITIATLDLGSDDEKLGLKTILGSAENIYSSTDNLYVTASTRKRAEASGSYDEMTEIHRFALEDGNVTYSGMGEVPGEILNQFSMDENGSYFRIATTFEQRSNNLFVLDDDLQIVGTLEDLAPGEKIYSVRFMGKRAYIVTFRQVDPFFAIDLSDPTSPTVLGELKIPGYSDYLHPYDENHIIGIGKDTYGDGTPAWYQGIKLSLFDVTDPTNPKEVYKDVIGDRGSESILLNDHRALLFDLEKGVMAFPVQVFDQGSNKLEFDGAYIYSLGGKEKMAYKGRISHLYFDQQGRTGQSSKSIQRLLYMDDDLYSISDQMIRVNGLDTLVGKGALEFPDASHKSSLHTPGGPNLSF